MSPKDNLLKRFNYKTLDIENAILNELEHLVEEIVPETMPEWIEDELGPQFNVKKIHEIRNLILGMRVMAENLRSDLILDYPHLKKDKIYTVFNNISGFCSRLLGRLITVEKGEGYAQFADIQDITRMVSFLQTQGAALAGLQRSYLERKDKILFIQLQIENLDEIQRKILFENIKNKYKDDFKKPGKKFSGEPKPTTVELVTENKEQEEDEGDVEEDTA